MGVSLTGGTQVPMVVSCCFNTKWSNFGMIWATPILGNLHVLQLKGEPDPALTCHAGVLQCSFMFWLQVI